MKITPRNQMIELARPCQTAKNERTGTVRGPGMVNSDNGELNRREGG